LGKIGLGYILGNFLTNSSGHPGCIAGMRLIWLETLFYLFRRVEAKPFLN
jgi:hypothetical protein